ncbi:hypothetical protein L195_g040173, partial [Trifolium pratense]
MTLFSSLQISTTFHSLNPSSSTILPRFQPSISLTKKSRTTTTSTITRASLIETPVLWVGRICIFYALLKTGFVGSPSNPLLSDLEIGDNGDSSESGGDLGFSKWTQSILGKP